MCRLYWTDRSRNTVESMSLQSMQHRVEDIPLSSTKVISDIASYKASEAIVCALLDASDSSVKSAARRWVNKQTNTG